MPHRDPQQQKKFQNAHCNLRPNSTYISGKPNNAEISRQSPAERHDFMDTETLIRDSSHPMHQPPSHLFDAWQGQLRQ